MTYVNIKLCENLHEFTQCFLKFAWTLIITGPCYSGVWICIAGFWDLQSPNHQFWDPMILREVNISFPSFLYLVASFFATFSQNRPTKQQTSSTSRCNGWPRWFRADAFTAWFPWEVLGSKNRRLITRKRTNVLWKSMVIWLVQKYFLLNVGPFLGDICSFSRVYIKCPFLSSWWSKEYYFWKVEEDNQEHPHSNYLF